MTYQMQSRSIPASVCSLLILCLSALLFGGDPPECPGDLDGNMVIDLDDVLMAAAEWGTETDLDLDADGAFTVLDLVLWQEDIGICPDASPQIGRFAVLQTFFHNVQGTATIINANTIRVDGFHYDATGLAVFFYVAMDLDFANGVAISDDLVRSLPYANETLALILPDQVSVDSFNSISVWCAPASADFGSGSFVDP